MTDPNSITQITEQLDSLEDWMWILYVAMTVGFYIVIALMPKKGGK